MTSRIKIAITSTIIAIIAVAGSFNEVKAYDITTTVSPTGNSWEWGTGTAWNVYTEDVASGNIGIANYTGQAIWIRGNLATTDISKGSNIIHRSVRSSNSISFKEGNYYITSISFGLASKQNVPIEMTELERVTVPNNAPYKFVSVTPQYNNCWQLTEGTNTVQGNVVLRYLDQTGCTYGAITFVFIFQATRTDTGTFQIGNGDAWTFRNHVWITDGQSSTTYGTINAQTITEYKPDNASVINQEQQEAGQQAQQEGQQGSDTSQSNVTQGTQSLLSAITGFVGVISNATPTNCRITGDMGALDLGELDFCQDNPPAIITTIGTLILIAITIPITIWVVKKIISLFRSFTNG